MPRQRQATIAIDEKHLVIGVMVSLLDPFSVQKSLRAAASLDSMASLFAVYSDGRGGVQGGVQMGSYLEDAARIAETVLKENEYEVIVGYV